MLAEFPLLFGLIISPPGSPVMPYLGVPIGWNKKKEHEGGPFLHLGATALPILETHNAVGLPMQHLHWRPVGLVGLGWAFNGDIYASVGTCFGEGSRLYSTVGVRFWPFSGEIHGKEAR